MPAGPLLNGRWCLYYASLGFDVLTYKTVRSQERACYELPNLQPIREERLDSGGTSVSAAPEMDESWAVSFGMPSKPPEVWRKDVEWTRDRLSPRKMLSVSVVATVQEGWTIEDTARDYARCGKWAVDSGADCVELNLSCPNVATSDGQLYQQPENAQIVAECVRQAIGAVPLILKIGYVRSETAAAALLDTTGDAVDALAMTNCIAATVGVDDELLFDGASRGIAGKAIFTPSVRQARLFAKLIDARNEKVKVIGVGGADCWSDVQHYLEAGAQSVQIATAAMRNPMVALEIRREMMQSSAEFI